MKPYLQYLVVLLDDTSMAYCHAENPLKERRLMPLDTLRKAILFGMKQNLMIQFVYPDYELPTEYNELIEIIDHVKIGREVKIFNSVPQSIDGDNVVLRLSVAEFVERQYDIATLLPQAKRLNICLTDIENFKDEQIEDYKRALATLNAVLLNLYKSAKQPQFNLITDRLQLTEMHNCEAGVGNITIAPNGKFYLCPAFYYDEQLGISNRMNHKTKDASRSVGDLEQGIDIPNKQLLQLDHAPLCRICDAYHCNRCIWLNQKLTWDNNTPSHQQCVISHLERNASRDLQIKMQEIGYRFENEIKEINYLDPFDNRELL
ncbi:MAG: CXXX repeat peptide maturase [Paludibacteraceae bacterium]|nr:CXXX repeat peptide maturase [Paludibacteraceae bacterium]